MAKSLEFDNPKMDHINRLNYLELAENRSISPFEVRRLLPEGIPGIKKAEGRFRLLLSKIGRAGKTLEETLHA